MLLTDIIKALQTYCPGLLSSDLLGEIKKNYDLLEREIKENGKVHLDYAYLLLVNTLRMMEEGLEGEMSLEDFLLLHTGQMVSDCLEKNFEGLSIDISIDLQKTEKRLDKLEEERNQKGAYVDQVNIKNPNGYVLLEEFFPDESVGMFEIAYEQLFDVIDMYKEVKENVVYDRARGIITNKELPKFGATRIKEEDDGSVSLYYNIPDSDLLFGLSFKDRIIMCIDAGALGLFENIDKVNIYYEGEKIGTAREILPKLDYYCVTRLNKVICIIGDFIIENI
jgi:hypothetical protein